MASNDDLLAQAKEIQRQKLLDQAKAVQAQKLSQNQDQEDPGLLDQAKEYGAKGLSAIGRGLDYAGGVTRTAGAYPFVKQVTGQDVINAFKANPLTGDEILNRAGVPQGASLSDVVPSAYSPTGDEWLKLQKGGWADPTARGAAGLGLEIASDPLTYASLGTSKIAKAALQAGEKLSPAEKLLQLSTRPVGYPLEELGKARYGSALRNVDESLKATGKPAISETFIQQGMPIGNMRSLRDQAKGIAQKTGAQIGDIEAQATRQGATVNMLPAMQDAMDLASEMRKSPHPEVQAAGQKLDEITMGYLERGENVPVEQARKWSTEANELAGAQAFNPMTAGGVPFSSEANREIGQGIKTQARQAIANVSPELGAEYELANKQYSTVGDKAAKREFKNAAKVERKKNAITLIDAALAAASASNPYTLPVLGAKKAMEFGNSTLGRTVTGRGLYELGNKGDLLLRRPSLWQDIYNKSQDGEQE